MSLINRLSFIRIILASIGLLAFPFAIMWILATAEIMDDLDDIKDEYSKIK